MRVNEGSLKARSARSSIFLIRTGITKLKEYQSRIAEPESLERLVIEADQLSQNLKRLESLITDSAAPEKKLIDTGPELDIYDFQFLTSMVAQGKICPRCGDVKLINKEQ